MTISTQKMLLLLMSGDKIKRPCFAEGEYLYLDTEDMKVKTENGIVIKSLDVNADDWEEYKE